jgi:hypothetical protein
MQSIEILIVIDLIQSLASPHYEQIAKPSKWHTWTAHQVKLHASSEQVR